ncbi:MAG: FeoA family protein [Faecalibacterium sp.]
MTLDQGKIGVEYTVLALHTEDEELDSFLFTLGCYEGEKIVIVSVISESYVVAIRDGRYNIDKGLAECIAVA